MRAQHVWLASSIAVAIVACGRVGFDPRTATDGGGVDAARVDAARVDAAQTDAGATPSSWRLVPGASEPGARWGPRLVYHAMSGQVLLYGGNLGDSDADLAADDMWSYDGTAWALVCDPCAPGPRQKHAFVYDAARNIVVLFGGERMAGGAENDLWEWNGTLWREVTAPGAPSPRSAAYAAYDPTAGHTMIFGGHGVDRSDVYADVYEWDGSAWSTFAPGGGPAARSEDGQSAAWSTAFGGIIVYGGTTDGMSAFDDAWGWSGATWARQCAACRGAPYVGTALIDITPSGTVIAIGGYDLNVGTRTPGGTERVVPTTWPLIDTGPTARDNSGVAYDAPRGVVVLYGGNGGGCGFSNCAETLEYRPAP